MIFIYIFIFLILIIRNPILGASVATRCVMESGIERPKRSDWRVDLLKSRSMHVNA